jgi:gluconolactonase
MAEVRAVASGLRFPEGPVAMPDGSVVLVEIERGTVTRVTADGQVAVVAETGGGPNGAALGPDGKLYVCNNGGFVWGELDGLLIPGDAPGDYTGGLIQRVDLETGAVDAVYSDCDGEGLRGPNDIVFDAEGGFYFTDLGKGHSDTGTVDRGALYYAQPDGSSIVRVAAPLDHPNGVGLSPDGRRLYAAETYTGRLWWWDVVGPGQLQGGATFFGSGGGNFLYSSSGYELFDSLAIDSGGNVCQATILRPGISVVSPDGELVDFVEVPGNDPVITNICFGGPDLRTAYITASGTGVLYATEWARPGAKLHFLNT